MRVTAPTARKYLDDGTARDMARRMLFEFAAEQPGADLLVVPSTVPVPLVFVGIIVAALAEAMQFRAANERLIALAAWSPPTGRCCRDSDRSPPGPRQARPTIRKRHVPARVAAPRRQAHQQCRRPGREWRQPPVRVPEAARGELAAAFRRDADRLITVTTTA